MTWTEYYIAFIHEAPTEHLLLLQQNGSAATQPSTHSDVNHTPKTRTDDLVHETRLSVPKMP